MRSRIHGVLEVTHVHMYNHIDIWCFKYKINHEPFLGGGSVLLALLSSDIECEKYRANDINKHLIQTYIDVRDKVVLHLQNTL